MAVVKADAYGHGVEKITTTLNSLGVNSPEYFGVAIIDEALELKKIKVKQPILVFDPVTSEQADFYIKNNIIPTVFEKRHLDALLKKKGNAPIKVHIKIDTGMRRLGIDFKDAVTFIKQVSRNKNFIIDGIYTHFATSDEKDKFYAELQLRRFKEIISGLKKENINYGLAHAANSGAILDMPDAYFDMVRPGISLYGYYPSLETTGSIKLKPVMDIVTKIGSVKVIKAGEPVSYSRRYYSKRKTNIITVPIGYADGISRSLTNKMKCLIKGKFYQQVGTVTMDRIMFDTRNDSYKNGENVTLLGNQKEKKIDAWDWSKILNTIPYEITCNISKRVPRIYKD